MSQPATNRMEISPAETETFNITVYYDNVIIETKSVANLASGTSKTLTIDWETTDVDPDTYTIKAVASTITGEIEFIGDSVTITVQEAPALGILLYVAAAVVAAIIIVAIAFYFLKARKQGVKEHVRNRKTVKSWSTERESKCS